MNVLDVLADYLVEHAPPGSRPYKDNYLNAVGLVIVSRVSYRFGTVFIYGNGKVLLMMSGVEHFQGDLADPDLVDALQKAIEDAHELYNRVMDYATQLRGLSCDSGKSQ